MERREIKKAIMLGGREGNTFSLASFFIVVPRLFFATNKKYIPFNFYKMGIMRQTASRGESWSRKV